MLGKIYIGNIRRCTEYTDPFDSSLSTKPPKGYMISNNYEGGIRYKSEPYKNDVILIKLEGEKIVGDRYIALSEFNSICKKSLFSIGASIKDFKDCVTIMGWSPHEVGELYVDSLREYIEEPVIENPKVKKRVR